MLRYETLAVTPLQQNCSIVWCDRRMERAVIDPGGDLPEVDADGGQAMTDRATTRPKPDVAPLARWPDRPIRSSAWVAAAGLLALAGCAAPPPAVAPELVAMQQRLQALEQRVEVLERYIWNLPSPPNRSRDEIERDIRSLERRRATLLERYTNAHPYVREIDLSLRLLKLQLEMMDPARSR
jgi:hypothetical protein